MIKNAVLFRMSNTAILNLLSLEEALLKQTFTECSPTQELSFGWVPPRGEEHGALVETINGHWIIKMMVESKKVPTDIVTRKLAEACDKIELESGRKPGKKQQRDLKEELKFGLLPSVLPKRHTILAWLDNKAGILVVDASSVGKCDLLISSLVKATDGINYTPICTKQSPSTGMSEWLLSGNWPMKLAENRACELKAADDSKAKVRYDNHCLSIDEIKGHLTTGKVFKSMALEWNQRVSFTLTDSMVLKKIDVLDSNSEADSNTAANGDNFDTDVVIATSTLTQTIQDLIESLGGEAETQEQAEAVA